MHRVATLACLLCLLGRLGAAESPTLEVAYDEPQDRACAKSRGYAIKDEWVAELNQILPAFRAQWNAKGPAMFAAVTSLTHRPIDQYIERVQLTLCDTPSESFSGPSVN